MKLKHFTFIALAFGLVALETKTAEAASLNLITDGISNARGLTFGPDGSLYVSEPGIGGNGNCQLSPSTLFQPICAGNTSSLVRISPDGKQERLFKGFDSLAEQPSGNQGAGIQDLQFDAKGNAYMLVGFAGYPGNRDLETYTLGSKYPIPPDQLTTFPPSEPGKLLDSPNLAKLFKADLETEELTPIFDFGEYEIINNPDGGDVVTNPFDFAIDGDTAYVTDGGGNAAYAVKLDGSEAKAVKIPGKIVDSSILPPLPPGQEFPPGLVEVIPPSEPGQAPQLGLQSVPTGGAVGPDGAFYVGEYTGFPYPEDESRIFRIGEDGKPTVYADGFNHITDLTFDKDGNLLVLQFSDQSQLTGDLRFLPGSLIQVAPDGTRTTLVAAGEGLESAAGITIGPDEKIYITKRGVGPQLGEVIQVDLGTGGTGGTGAEPVPEPITGLFASAFLAFGGGAYMKRKQQQQQSQA